ncbi:hypothetical protein [Cohnella massiliensis]|uniref:hypothetical protein n=1 Tax=Cohnella massiliensis TaxID=1816691 RepID=UPI0009BB08EE|nr:hypothetical protein [Cohnella massiliensis]
MIGFLIVACEIGFWVFVGAGLFFRYALNKRKAGAWLLACTPVVDLILLAAAVIDLRSGAEPSWTHNLAAVYVGVSVAFGHRMIRWADARFAHRFKGGEAPRKLYGKEHAAHERKGWLLHLAAWAIGGILLLVMSWLAGEKDLNAESPFVSWILGWAVVLGIDFLISFSYTLWPREPKGETSARG